MKRAEVVFVPALGVGHFVSAVELAKLLVNSDDRLSATVLIMKGPVDFNVTKVIQALCSLSENHDGDDSSSARIKFLQLALDNSISEFASKSFEYFLTKFAESHKPAVKDVAAEIARSDSSRLAAFVVDIFCISMIDVASEFGVPSYVYYTSSAASLGFWFHLQTLADEENLDFTVYKDSDTEFSVPSFISPVPCKILPSFSFAKERSDTILDLSRKIRGTKGIIVNTFLEMESHAIESLSDGKIPTIYPVGPILNQSQRTDGQDEQYETLMKWLDDQPASSVVFLCFGSMGSFDELQVKEIALALEQSGHRFLWSLRRPPPTSKMEYPTDYENPEEILPEGFLERTAHRGKIIGWAPQSAVLSHPAIGGFVSHCGWNSTLESVWNGVTMGTWPMYAEQQINAFQIVKELGIGVEVKMDYRKDFAEENEDQMILKAELIESTIRKLMESEDECSKEVRKKLKEMRETSRAAMADGGSSHTALGRLIEDVIND